MDGNKVSQAQKTKSHMFLSHMEYERKYSNIMKREVTY
jgi:hypothetical protein